MVRQRSDPGGAKATNPWTSPRQDAPDAQQAVRQGKSPKYSSYFPPGSPMNSIVVDDTIYDDSRHVVDEIRGDDVSGNKPARECDNRCSNELESGAVIDLTNNRDDVEREQVNSSKQRKDAEEEGGTTTNASNASWFLFDWTTAGATIGEAFSNLTDTHKEEQGKSPRPALVSDEFNLTDPIINKDEKYKELLSDEFNEEVGSVECEIVGGKITTTPTNNSVALSKSFEAEALQQVGSVECEIVEGKITTTTTTSVALADSFETEAEQPPTLEKEEKESMSDSEEYIEEETETPWNPQETDYDKEDVGDEKHPILVRGDSSVVRGDSSASTENDESESTAEENHEAAPEPSVVEKRDEESVAENPGEDKKQEDTPGKVGFGSSARDCGGCLCFSVEEDGLRDDDPTATSEIVEEQTKAVPMHRSVLSNLFQCADPAPTPHEAKKEEAKPESKQRLAIDTSLPSGEPSKLSETMDITGDDEDDDGDDADDEDEPSTLLDVRNDLQSIPSVDEDVKETVAPYQKGDFGASPKANSAEMVESNMKKIDEKIETSSFKSNHIGAQSSVKSNQTATSLKSEQSGTTFSTAGEKSKRDPSLEGRRVILVKELRTAISSFGRYDIRCANISAALADLLVECGEFGHAIKLHRDSVTIYSCKLGDDHSTTLTAKTRLASVLGESGEVEEAIMTYYQVTSMRRALYGDQDPSVADGLVSMAHVLRKNNDYMQAIKELKRALKIYRESLGDSHEKVASTVDEIASLYVTVGDFNKSAAILEEVVKLKAATLGTKSKGVASTLLQLANAYECSEKFDNAMKALKKAYKIYTEIIGYSSEEAGTTLNRMARLYEATNDYNRASVAYLGVLRGRKIQRGPDHLSVGETYYHLAHALRETHQYDKALKCLKEALPIFVGQGVEMNDVEMVADIMHEMALISLDRGQFQDAARIFKQELSVRRKVGQPEFPFAARTLKHLGVTEYTMKNYSRSLKYLVEALSIHQNHEDQGVECGEVLFHTGLVFFKVNNKERALEALVEAVRIFGDHGLADYPLNIEANKKIDEIRYEMESPQHTPTSTTYHRFSLAKKFGKK